MLVIECGQYFSFRCIVISSYLGFSSPFRITNNPNTSIISRGSIRGFRVLPLSEVPSGSIDGQFPAYAGYYPMSYIRNPRTDVHTEGMLRM